MTISEIESIKEKIKNAEIKSARAQGVIDNIKKEWKEKYGTDDIEEIKIKLNDLKKNQVLYEEKINKLMKKLNDSYNWDSLE